MIQKVKIIAASINFKTSLHFLIDCRIFWEGVRDKLRDKLQTVRNNESHKLIFATASVSLLVSKISIICLVDLSCIIGLVGLIGIVSHVDPISQIGLAGPIGFSDISSLVGQISLLSLSGLSGISSLIGQISLVDFICLAGHNCIIDHIGLNGFSLINGVSLISLIDTSATLNHRLIGLISLIGSIGFGFIGFGLIGSLLASAAS
jgi:hypothetical protein